MSNIIGNCFQIITGDPIRKRSANIDIQYDCFNDSLNAGNPSGHLQVIDNILKARTIGLSTSVVLLNSASNTWCIARCL
jgi:hypothetical protein